MASNTKTLLHFEDLALPSFQVIVMSANRGCAQCREKVSKVTSKMTGAGFIWFKILWLDNVKAKFGWHLQGCCQGFELEQYWGF
ncbi:hypothetical protein ES319_A05G387700v1 [Gossypium barbadense]|uniref:HMA domain-containing protein n=1 Tax=Gossypium barbadense TaxID=3634 RepID=A0A5J5VZW2_GOSBA|nr:hypothetical protein ES319_A05G387700v1 [Gossypium barbadense]